jgi:hypothetical protein
MSFSVGSRYRKVSSFVDAVTIKRTTTAGLGRTISHGHGASSHPRPSPHYQPWKRILQDPVLSQPPNRQFPAHGPCRRSVLVYGQSGSPGLERRCRIRRLPCPIRTPVPDDPACRSIPLVPTLISCSLSRDSRPACPRGYTASGIGIHAFTLGRRFAIQIPDLAQIRRQFTLA